MEEMYCTAKRLVLSKFSESDPNYPLYVIGLNTLLHHYKDYTDIVINKFIETEIHIEDAPIRETIIKYNLLDEEDLEDEKADNEVNTYSGVSFDGRGVKYIDEKCVIEKTSPFIVCNSSCDRTEVLNIFVHEFNHLIKGVLEPAISINNSDVTIRSGIDYCICHANSPCEDFCTTMDEVINTLETTDMLKDILMLDGIITDTVIQEYIDSLDKEKLRKDYGYEATVKIMRPLWENDSFRSLIEENIMTGNLYAIASSFEEVVGDGYFDELSTCLDEIEYLDTQGDDKEMKSYIRKAQGIINAYNKKTISLLEK